MKKQIRVLILIIAAIPVVAFGQVKNPVIVFDTGSATYSSADNTFFSADGKYLGIADGSNINPSIKIIDVASGLPIKTIRGENNYWRIQFSNDFKYIRYNRLATSNTDTNKFEAIRNTFTGELLFKRKIDDFMTNPMATFFGNQIVIEDRDSAILKKDGMNSENIVLHTNQPFELNGYIFFRPSWGSSVLSMFQPQTKTIRKIDFSKEDAPLMTGAELADLEQNKHNTYTLETYGYKVTGQYVIAIMESGNSPTELVKVFDLEKNMVVFSAEKPKIPYQDAILYGAVQFDKNKGTITYATKDGLAVNNIFSRQLVVIPFSKPGTESINCSIDENTGEIITWCRHFVKVFEPKKGQIVYDSDMDKTMANNSAQLKFSDVKQNPSFPYLYIRKFNPDLSPDSTGIFDMRVNKFIKKQMCNIIAISGNGKYIYARNKFRYCLMNENLDIVKYINDCSLVTTDIGEEDAPGNARLLKTKIDYMCPFAKQQDGLTDDKVFFWDIKKLSRSTQNNDQSSAFDDRHITRGGYDILLLPKQPDYLSNHPTTCDTLCLTKKQSGVKTSIFFIKGMIKAVDVDTIKKLIITVASVDYKDDFLFIHDLTGKLISRYPLHLKNDLTLYDTKMLLTNMNHTIILKLAGLQEGEVTLVAYNLLNSNIITENKVTQGNFNITSTGDLLIVNTHPETDTLFTKSLSTGVQTTKKMRFNSFNNDLIVYFEPEDDWYKDSFMFYPKNGEIIVKDVVKNQVLYEAPIKDDDIHSAIVSCDKKYLAYPNRYGEITLVDLQSKSIVTRFTGHNDEVRRLYFTQNYPYLMSASDDGTMRLWSINEKKEKLKIVNFGSDGYIMLSPEGYYRSSRSAIKKFGYVSGTHVLDAGQLDIRYNRPDKVLHETGSTDTALINAYHRAYEKRLKKLGVDTTAFKPGYSIPEADFTNREEITYEQTGKILKLHITGGDSTFALDRFNVWVNNSPMFGIKGYSLNKGSHLLDTTISITLTDNDNVIETSVTNTNSIESARMPLYVKYTPNKPNSSKLYFIGIGIDKFADSRHNLQWSAKDVRDLAQKFGQRYAKSCEIDTLFNEDVTLKNVTALKDKLLKTNVNDKVIIAYSGHGLLSSDYDYYLSSYDVDFDNPAHNGIPYDALENLLDDIPARKKLMLIDACHSGEVDKEDMKAYQANIQSLGHNGTGMGRLWQKQKGKAILGTSGSFELMQQLFSDVGKNSGATVISAASGTQFAQERGNLENGVFTFSILEYLNQQSHCNISSLKEYVNKRVTDLTNGMQVPTTRTENDAVDWQVW